MALNRSFSLYASLLAVLFVAVPALGQINNLSREELIRYTAQNPYERFSDGRPKVPDTVLSQLKDLSAEDFLGLAARGSNHFADGFRLLSPDKKLVGRAFTVQLMPVRAEVGNVDAAAWKEKGNAVALNHQSAIDMLQPGDVFVVDAGGGLEGGGIIGNNLSYYIWKKTGAGFVIDGAIRDLEGMSEYGMAGYFRGAVPPPIHGLMVTGINVPVRIGKVTVLPGDIVFGDKEGVTFIPPHMIQGVVDAAKITRIKDEWTQKKFDEGKYKSTDIYGRPHDPALVKEYEDYLKQKLGPAEFEAYKNRQNQPRPEPSKPR